MSIWNTLRLVHAAGVAHCDIRVTNCMKIINGNVIVLIDWSYARPLAGLETFSNVHPPPLYQSPTLITASNAVLSQFKTRNFAVTVIDEAVSLIWMALQAKFSNMKSIRKAYGTVGMTLEMRELFIENMRSMGRKWDKRFPNMQPAQVGLVDRVVDALDYLMNHREAGIDDVTLNEFVSSTVHSIFQMSFTIPDDK
jgi:serine/threonine protein kinase